MCRRRSPRSSLRSPRGNRPLPAANAATGESRRAESRGEEDFAGLRSYAPGVPLKHMAWKILARGGEAAVRIYSDLGARPEWLEWSSLDGLDTETRLSQLCRWITECEAGLPRPYGLRIPGDRHPARPRARSSVAMSARAGLSRNTAGMKLAVPSATQVTYDQLRWMSVCLALALAVHAASLPVWLLAAIAAAVAIRLALAARGYAAPSRTIRIVVAVVSIGILFLQLHTFNGVAAGSALLSLVAGLKLFETQSRRDLYVVALIIYFLSLAALLRSESFWLFAYLLAVSWLTTATLLRLGDSTQPSDWRRSARYAGRISAQALPLALVLWLFFPRFDGPLWRVPSDARGAETGLSDTMSPGDITDLALSDDIAFRVHFDGPPPPPAERYWRGPVLHDFDGRTWRRTIAFRGPGTGLAPLGIAYRYVVSLEPNRHNWIFALDWPDRWDFERRLSHRRRHAGTAFALVAPARREHLLAHACPIDGAVERGRAPPRHTAPERNAIRRTRQLALDLRRSHPDDIQYVNAVLDMFHRQQFFYTLEPPPLGVNSVDEFLFDTKRGFCGHYASAFAALMRAAGIPARVVTGYHGGLYNRFADYWIVAQSDAHAWDEVWIEGRGWMRVDPTSAVAPGRVEPGSEGALAAGSRLSGPWRQPLSWLADARLELDALRQLWRERILSFDQHSQDSLLGSLGIPEPDGQKVAMVMGAGLVLVFIWLTWQIRREQRPDPKDPVLRAYHKLCRKLAAAGLPRRPSEGAEAFAARVATRAARSGRPRGCPLEALFAPALWREPPRRRRAMVRRPSARVQPAASRARGALESGSRANRSVKSAKTRGRRGHAGPRRLFVAIHTFCA